MKEHENDFPLESSEQQIESWLDDLSKEDHRSLQNLQSLSQAYLQKNERSLDRIWDRLVQSQEHSVPLQRDWKEHKYLYIKAPGRAIQGWDPDGRLRKDRKVMQNTTASQQVSSPGSLPASKKRTALWRGLGISLIAAIAIVLVASFTIFASVLRPASSAVTGAASNASQPSAISNGKLVCSVANDSAAQGQRPWLSTLSWSSQGQIANTFMNLKVFSGSNCASAFSASTQSFSGNWSPDGKKLVLLESNPVNVQRSGGTAFTLNTGGRIDVQGSNGDFIARLSADELGTEWVSAATWTPDSKNIIYLSSDAKNPTVSVKSVEAVDGGKVTSLLTFNQATAPLNRVPNLVSLSPDGKLVAVELLNVVKTQTGATTNGISGIEIWSVGSGKKLSSISLTQSGLLSSSIAWSPDGSQIALVAGEKSTAVQIFATASGTMQASFEDTASSAQGISSLSWSPDGNFLAEGASAINIWDIQTKKIITTFGQVDAGHRISAQAWSPDSKGLASATATINDKSKNTVSVWKLS